MIKCEFCSKEYTTEKILKNHQKTAIFCKNIQSVSVLDPKRIQSSSDSLKIDNSLNFKCEHCRDTFTQKITLKQHYERCKIRLEKIKEENELKNQQIISKIQEENEKLKNQLLFIKEELNSYKLESVIKEEKLKIKE